MHVSACGAGLRKDSESSEVAEVMHAASHGHKSVLRQRALTLFCVLAKQVVPSSRVPPPSAWTHLLALNKNTRCAAPEALTARERSDRTVLYAPGPIGLRDFVSC